MVDLFFHRSAQYPAPIPSTKIANLSLDIWDQEYVNMMDASEMRELRETADCGCINGMGLGKTFTVQLIPDLRAFLLS